MNTQHTPGPWTVEYRTLKNARGESIASAGNNRKVWGGELESSLRLAAAAPDLLEALEWLVAEVSANTYPKSLSELGAIGRASAAIAKATGGNA